MPPNECAITRRNAAILFPDYVLARFKPGGGARYEISFAESKGCKASLEKLTTAPPDWKNQSENAQFIFRDTALTITQYLLIATRVYPFGKRPKTRRIQVRAWNSTTPNARVTFNALREVVVAHYFGVCVRVGLSANAQLLALRNYSPKKDKDSERKRVLEVTERLLDRAGQEIHREPIANTVVCFGQRPPKFTVGALTIRVGLSEPAMKLIQALQHPRERNDEGLLGLFEREVAQAIELLSVEEDIFFRRDGVIGQAIER